MIGLVDTSDSTTERELETMSLVETGGDDDDKDGPDGTRTNPTPPTHRPEGTKGPRTQARTHPTQTPEPRTNEDQDDGHQFQINKRVNKIKIELNKNAKLITKLFAQLVGIAAHADPV